MESILQKNEEQMAMLCVAIEDTSSGICLFQSKDSAGQIEIAQKAANLVEKKCAVLDMAKLEKAELPDEIGKLRFLLKGQETAQVIFLCNLQICGAMLGDEKYIERLNYMRDQMMVMEKVWVFGTSPYFAMLLSRKARDLYSCIMNHFEFVAEEEMERTFETIDEPLGDMKLNIQKFEEYKKRMEFNSQGRDSLEKIFQILDLWNKVKGYYDRSAENWILGKLEMAEVLIRENGLEKKAIRDYLNMAKSYAYSEYKDKAMEWIDKIACMISEGMSKELDIIADSYKTFGEIYAWNKEYQRAEHYFLMALERYHDLRGKDSKESFQIQTDIAENYRMQKDYDKALRFYIQIKKEFVRCYGKRDTYLININNGLGNAYVVMEQYSEAFRCYEEALEEQQYLIPNNRDVKIILLNNLSIVNRMLGRDEKAEQNLKEALQISGSIENRHILKIYINLYLLYEKRKEWKEAVKYGSKIVNLAEKTGYMEDRNVLRIKEKIDNGGTKEHGTQ